MSKCSCAQRIGLVQEIDDLNHSQSHKCILQYYNGGHASVVTRDFRVVSGQALKLAWMGV